MTIQDNDLLDHESATRTRITELLPMMDERYQRLKTTLDRAASGEDIPAWQLELERADLASVLEVMHPTSRADEDEDEDLWP